MVYFIADTHFGHKTAAGRGPCRFATTEERDETLIERWNRKVRRSDTVYILGDFVCKSVKSPEYYIKRLNGKKVLITGNHDVSWQDKPHLTALFEAVNPYHEMHLGGKTITLCHYPMLEWRNSRKVGSKKLGYLIHGHIHDRTDELFHPLFSVGNALNAGVEVNNYEPVTFEELMRNNERFKLATLQNAEQKARFLCVSYHMHQCDKAGAPYFEHPFRVAEALKDPTERIVALLHDTLEDTSLSPATIEELFGREVLEAVQTLTHAEGEEYFNYIERIKKNELARAVKMADLRDNMDLSRLRHVTDVDLARVAKYRRAMEFLAGKAF